MSDEPPVVPPQLPAIVRSWGPGILIVLCVFFAASRAFIVDDAYISLRYAEHFAQGHGLVFNVGEWTEGYTNFAWTVLLALPFALDVDPVTFMLSLSIAFFAGSLFVTHRLARQLLGDERLSLLCVAALGFSQTFSAYATSGLETQMNAFLTLWLVFIAMNAHVSIRQGILFSLVGAAAVLTRPDSALIAAFWGLWLVWRHRSPPRRLALVVGLIVPAAVVLGTWLAFKYTVYGGILPNTLYAKVGGSQDFAWGLDYMLAFSLATGLLPAGILSPLWRSKGPHARGVAPLWWFTVCWCVYVVSVGGDFMEYRFMVVAIPVFFMLVIESFKHRPLAALGAVLALVGWSHAAPLSLTHRAGIEDIDMLASHLTAPVQDWEGVGKQLHADLPAGSSVLVATTAAGAIPYYSKLPSLDMLGLTDAEVARDGLLFEAQRNHTRIASIDLLVARGVNLMVGQPWLRRPWLRRPPPRRSYRLASLRGFNVFKELRRDQLPSTARIVEVPLPPGGGGERVLVALYLHPHPDVEELLRAGRWRVYRLN